MKLEPGSEAKLTTKGVCGGVSRSKINLFSASNLWSGSLIKFNLFKPDRNKKTKTQNYVYWAVGCMTNSWPFPLDTELV